MDNIVIALVNSRGDGLARSAAQALLDRGNQIDRTVDQQSMNGPVSTPGSTANVAHDLASTIYPYPLVASNDAGGGGYPPSATAASSGRSVGQRIQLSAITKSKLIMRRTESCHFYLGRVVDASRFSRFLAEHYDEDENQPISEFYGSQGEFFCDHNFMETGQRKPGTSLEEFFAPHSYSDKWSEALCEAARAVSLEDANVLIFINIEQVKSPRSVRGEGFELVYIGMFEYPI